MIAVDAATILRLPGIGRLEPGGPADLLVLPSVAPAPLGSVLAVDRAGVHLVRIAGRACVGSLDMENVFESMRVDIAEVQIDKQPKLMAETLVTRLRKSGLKEVGITT